jgi:hypothetical protein
VIPLNLVVSVAADLVAVAILAYGLYFRRYYRRDLMVAYVALNVGVLVVTAILIYAAVGVGLGLGLFGILSIIRLRSDTVSQEEIAYYFVALTLGLVAGVHPGPIWLSPGLSGVLLFVVYLVDHPRLMRRTRRQKVTLDAAYTDERAIRGVLTGLLRAEICHVIVDDVDFVRDTTTVDVRFRPARTGVPISPPVTPMTYRAGR